MKEENFSPQQSMDIIKSMIDKAKNQFSDDGHLYLLWGWVVLVCSLTQFVLLYFFQYPNHYLVWILTWLAFIYQFIYLYKKKRKEKVKTYANQLLSVVWITFVVMMFLLAFIIVKESGETSYKYVNPVFLILYGMPTMLSGVILQFKPLKIGAIFCWVLALMSQFISYDFQLLLISMAMVVAWIIPGYMMRNKYKQQKS